MAETVVLGPAVIDWLRGRAVPQDVDVIDGGTAGLDLIDTLMNYRRAIIVDAADLQRASGDWLRFTPDVARLKNSDGSLSLHSAGLTEALALGTALNLLPPDVIIYGVQPAQIDWSQEMTASIKQVVPIIGAAILREVTDE